MFDELPTEHRRALRDAILQLVRNAVIHGIEPPSDRQSVAKDACGCITIKIEIIENGSAVRLSCCDDGAGLDTQAIRNRAVSEGMITEKDAMQLSESALCTLIFEPGFSTSADVTQDAGRGVGLDAVRAAIVGQLDGEIQIEFAAGRHCKFELLVPISPV